MVCREQRIKRAAVESPVGTLEHRVRHDAVADHVVRNIELQPRRFLIDQALIDQLTERVVDDPHLFCLPKIDGAAELAAQPFERRLHRRLQGAGVDALGADRGHRRIGRTVAEDVADPPDPEGHDQDDE